MKKNIKTIVIPNVIKSVGFYNITVLSVYIIFLLNIKYTHIVRANENDFSTNTYYLNSPLRILHTQYNNAFKIKKRY
jgi:hypothetical protein